jgi:hypothetical protein
VSRRKSPEQQDLFAHVESVREVALPAAAAEPTVLDEPEPIRVKFARERFEAAKREFDHRVRLARRAVSRVSLREDAWHAEDEAKAAWYALERARKEAEAEAEGRRRR